MEKEYKIDYTLFTVYEIVRIVDFFQLIEQTKTKRIDPSLLKARYIEYRNIINNISLEKQYDKMLYEKSKVSIYQVMKNLV